MWGGGTFGCPPTTIDGKDTAKIQSIGSKFVVRSSISVGRLAHPRRYLRWSQEDCS